VAPVSSPAPAPGSAPALPESSDRAVALRLFQTYLRSRWPQLALAMLCAAVVAIASAAFAKLLEPAFNDVLVAADPDSLLRIPLAIVAWRWCGGWPRWARRR
jgi:hypothetical protein